MERSRQEQVAEDAAVSRADLAVRYAMTNEVLSAYGEYVASLAPWSWFVSLTHDAKRLRYAEGWRATKTRDAWVEDPSGQRRRARLVIDAQRVVVDTGITQVRAHRHRKQVREWFYDDVRPRDRDARWWSEMELHESGQAHEHGLLAIRDTAAILSIRQAWFDRCGYARLDRVTSAEGAAVYVAKYTGKSAAAAPCIYGIPNLGAVTQLRERWWVKAVAGAALDPTPA